MATQRRTSETMAGQAEIKALLEKYHEQSLQHQQQVNTNLMRLDESLHKGNNRHAETDKRLGLLEQSKETAEKALEEVKSEVAILRSNAVTAKDVSTLTKAIEDLKGSLDKSTSEAAGHKTEFEKYKQESALDKGRLLGAVAGISTFISLLGILLGLYFKGTDKNNTAQPAPIYITVPPNTGKLMATASYMYELGSPYGVLAAPRRMPLSRDAMRLSAADVQRTSNYKTFWRFYFGEHWEWARDDGEPLVTMNYCAVVAEKGVSFLGGKGATFDVHTALQGLTKPVIDEVWEYNNKSVLLNDILLTGGVSGDVFLLITYVEPTQHEMMLNPNSRGKIKLKLHGSEQVFPSYNPLDQSKIDAVRIEHLYQADTEAEVKQINGKTQTTTTNNQFRRFTQIITSEWITEFDEDQEVRKVRNILGEIPLVHIKNRPNPRSPYGISDLHNLIKIQEEINHKATDMSDIINYHAAPVIVIYGAKLVDIDKGPKSIWSGLSDTAKIEHLELKGDLAAAHRYLELVKETFFDLAGLPESSLGRQQAISNTSAAALEITFWPLIEQTSRKRPAYEKGLEQINYFILRYHQIFEGVDYPTDLCKCCGGRIVETPITGADGKPVLNWAKKQKTKKKCYRIDSETFEFMKLEDAPIKQNRQFSYGEEVREMSLKQAKKEYMKQGASAYDPGGEKDLEDLALDAAKKREQIAQLQADAIASAAPAPVPAGPGGPGGASGGSKAQQETENVTPDPANPKLVDKSKYVGPPVVVPAELDPDSAAKVPQLSKHDMDIPEEPETVNIQRRRWNPELQVFVYDPVEKLEIIPTGCKRPIYLNPYENKATLRSSMPRDRERVANLFAAYQANHWASIEWIQKNLDEDFGDLDQLNRAIDDDLARLSALNAKSTKMDGAGVAQTPGIGSGGLSPGQMNAGQKGAAQAKSPTPAGQVKPPIPPINTGGSG